MLSLFVATLRMARAKRSVYTGSFLLGGVAVFATNSVLFLSFFAMVRFLGDSSPISLDQLCILYGISFISTALARMSAAGLDFMATESRRGGLDAMLVRPASMSSQILCYDFLLRNTVPLIIWSGALVYFIAKNWADVQPLILLFLPVYLFHTTLFVYSLQAIGYTASLFVPGLTILGEVVDPVADLSGKIPVDASSVQQAPFLIFANLLSFAFMDGLFDTTSTLFLKRLALLMTCSWIAFLIYRKLLDKGLRNYSSGG